MNILFVHNGFPGQYRHIAPFLVEGEHARVMVATLESNPQAIALDHLRYSPHREVSPGIHRMLVPAEKALLNAQAAYQTLYDIRMQGYRPDLICAHAGSGPAHLLKDLWPEAKLLALHEWFFRARRSHIDFLGPITEDLAGRVRMRNVPILTDLAAQDWGIVPTCFQLSQFPPHLRGGLSVMHDGIDTEFFSPGSASVKFQGRTFTRNDEIITYTTRGMEPYRGFPQFMAAVARLQKQRPNLEVIIAGNDLVAYGEPREDGKTWREEALETLELDHDRLHFTGLIPLEALRGLFRISSAHVYLTVPFVLSWSMMEAMATGAPIVASRTEPVEEMIRHEHEGLLVDFFDTDEHVAAIARLLDDAPLRQRLGAAACARIVAEYDKRTLVQQQWELMQAVARGELSASNEVLTLSDLSHE